MARSFSLHRHPFTELQLCTSQYQDGICLSKAQFAAQFSSLGMTDIFVIMYHFANLCVTCQFYQQQFYTYFPGPDENIEWCKGKH